MGNLDGKVAIITGGATATGMIPEGVSEELCSRLLKPEIIVPPAVFLASDEGRRLTGRRLTALEWSPQNPDGVPAALSIGGGPVRNRAACQRV
jgi:3-oxoacyl-[acyl-carrier protein] reductase